jgi:hypothetical protein
MREWFFSFDLCMTWIVGSATSVDMSSPINIPSSSDLSDQNDHNIMTHSEEPDSPTMTSNGQGPAGGSGRRKRFKPQRKNGKFRFVHSFIWSTSVCKTYCHFYSNRGFIVTLFKFLGVCYNDWTPFRFRIHPYFWPAAPLGSSSQIPADSSGVHLPPILLSSV